MIREMAGGVFKVVAQGSGWGASDRTRAGRAHQKGSNDSWEAGRTQDRRAVWG
jgi:hypothetical protein